MNWGKGELELELEPPVRVLHLVGLPQHVRHQLGLVDGGGEGVEPAARLEWDQEENGGVPGEDLGQLVVSCRSLGWGVRGVGGWGAGRQGGHADTAGMRFGSMERLFCSLFS